MNSPRKLIKRDYDMDPEEKQFLKLYDSTIDYILDKSGISDSQVSRAIEAIIESFRYSEGRQFSNIDLNLTENICAYLFRYSALHTGLVRSLLTKSIRNCQALRNVLCLPETNVVSLGGGPGCDLIGFCSALYENRYLVVAKNLNLTVVDSVRRWSSCFNIIEFLTRERDYGNVSELFKLVEVNTSFIRANLSGDHHCDRKYIRTLNEADIVLMVKLLSILPIRLNKDIMKSVMQEMKPGALLVFIDAPLPDNLFIDLDVIYRSVTKEEYTFSGTHSRFNFSNAKNSAAFIVVLRKRNVQEEDV